VFSNATFNSFTNRKLFIFAVITTAEKAVITAELFFSTAVEKKASLSCAKFSHAPRDLVKNSKKKKWRTCWEWSKEYVIAAVWSARSSLLLFVQQKTCCKLYRKVTRKSTKTLHERVQKILHEWVQRSFMKKLLATVINNTEKYFKVTCNSDVASYGYVAITLKQKGGRSKEPTRIAL